MLSGAKSDWNAAATPWANVDQRARAYIAANCSGCHGRRGILTGIGGRTVDIRPVGAGAYALPFGLPKGVYILRVGKATFTRSLF